MYNTIFKINFILWFFIAVHLLLSTLGVINELTLVSLLLAFLCVIFGLCGISKVVGLLYYKKPVNLEAKIFSFVLVAFFILSTLFG